MQSRHKSTIPACYTFMNVAIGPEDSYDWIEYIKMNNHVQHLYHVNGPLSQLSVWDTA